MSYTEVDFISNGKTLYKVAATNHNPDNNFVLAYCNTSLAQPVAVVPGNLQLVEIQGTAALPTSQPSDRTPWVVFEGGVLVGTAFAYSVDINLVPGYVRFATEAGFTAAYFVLSAATAIFRADFLIQPPPGTYPNP